ncbi:hypothetical protein DFS34DRAFT_619252 [Phlyctochytrium arcticum]|nr:hypothetical protein DFS34DRAFT_619252 [Phlyctochytrium arcticum]
MVETTTTQVTRIVIIGGSYGAIAASTQLDKLLASNPSISLTLISPTDKFFHFMAGLRSLVEPSIGPKLLIPYTNLFQKTKGTVVQGRVVKVEKEKVVLEDGREIGFDFLVIATGTSYPSPGKTCHVASKDTLAELESTASAVASASKIVIIGGGPVGIEAAGEIATDYPTKSVTLIHSTDKLMPGNLSDAFKAKLLKSLQSRGVNVLLNTRAEGLDTYFPEKGKKGVYAGPASVATSTGQTLDANLVILATGNAKFNSEFMTSLGADILDSRGQIIVTPTLQLPSHPNMFAIGDVNNLDAKFGFLAQQMATLTATNISKLISNPSATLAPYSVPSSAVALVTVGRNGGAAQIFTVWGDWVAKTIKSKELFVKKTWGSLNATSLMPV